MEAGERKDHEQAEELSPAGEDHESRDPEQILGELEREFGDDLNPALRRVLKERKAIGEWLREPGNAAAFRLDPVQALGKQFPDLKLKRKLKDIYRVPITLGGVDLSGVDQATIDFFSEVWKYVAESAANANAFEADTGGTIALLGKGKPDHAVQKVAEAFHVDASGKLVSIQKIAREKIFHEIIDPIGPVPGPGRSFLTRLRPPPGEELDR